jgi:glutaredoxin
MAMHLFRFLVLLIACNTGSSSPALADNILAESSAADIEVFVREGCPHCVRAKTFLEQLKQERPSLQILVHDVGQSAVAAERLTELAAARHVQTLGVPAFLVGGELLIGYDEAGTTGSLIRSLLDRGSPRSGERLPPGACGPQIEEPCRSPSDQKEVDQETVTVSLVGRLSARDLGLPLFTLVLGLLDGFNPCAMWVLLFLLSLLVNLRDRKKIAVIAGTFVLVSGLVYFAFMAAWLNLFRFVGYSRITELLLGGVALSIGALNLKDALAVQHGFSIGIPESAKPGLYARTRRILQADHMAGAVVGVVVLAFLVNVIELLCTAGLPAAYTRILTLRQLDWWQYYGYLALYNLAYIADDSLMVAIAVVTLSRHKLQAREGRWLKLLSGSVMAGLGLILLFKPDWLH